MRLIPEKYGINASPIGVAANDATQLDFDDGHEVEVCSGAGAVGGGALWLSPAVGGAEVLLGFAASPGHSLFLVE